MGNASSSTVLPPQNRPFPLTKKRSEPMVFSKILGRGSVTPSSVVANGPVHDGVPWADEKYSSPCKSQETPALAYSPSYTFTDSSDPAAMAYNEFLKVYPGMFLCGICYPVALICSQNIDSPGSLTPYGGPITRDWNGQGKVTLTIWAAHCIRRASSGFTPNF
jgi:hypothetical protein